MSIDNSYNLRYSGFTGRVFLLVSILQIALHKNIGQFLQTSPIKRLAGTEKEEFAMKKIPYGESNFEKIIQKGFLYVDKTKYLKDLETTSKLVYLRPRRLGKSLFTSMLDYYYGVDHADKFDELFQGLYVHENPTEYRNKYYMLKFNFSGTDLISQSTEEMRKTFGKRVELGLEDFCERYDFPVEFDL